MSWDAGDPAPWQVLEYGVGIEAGLDHAIGDSDPLEAAHAPRAHFYGMAMAADDAVLGHPAQLWGGSQSLPLWQLYLGVKKARYLLMSGRRISGKEAAEMGLVSISVPLENLEAEVDKLAAEITQIPYEGALHNKIALNTDLKMKGIDALFDYYGQMNRYYRLFQRR